VTWKAVQDRYKRLEKDYDHADGSNKRLSGVGGGEMGELADLLMNMREAKDDMEAQNKALKTTGKKKEEDKEKMGQVLVDMATKRKAAENAGSVVLSADEDTDEPESARKADLARVEQDRKRLSFEQERALADRIERERGREERRIEREEERRERREERLEMQKLELEQFKAMMEAFNRKKSKRLPENTSNTVVLH